MELRCDTPIRLNSWCMHQVKLFICFEMGVLVFHFRVPYHTSTRGLGGRTDVLGFGKEATYPSDVQLKVGVINRPLALFMKWLGHIILVHSPRFASSYLDGKWN